MSDSSQSPEDAAMAPPEPTFSNRTLTLFGIAGTFLVFLFILFVAWLPNRGEPVQQQIIDTRKAALAEYRAAEAEKMESLDVVDPETGRFKIPVDQAIELTVRDFAGSDATATPDS